MLRALRTVPLLVLGVFSFGGIPAEAQFATSQDTPLSMIISPQSPRPYQTITVTPSSSGIDLISSVVSVSVNGKVVEKGSGVQSVPVTVGGPGERTDIKVTAVTGGQSYSATVSIRPADVALVVEPVSTTHPFYAGASLVAPSGRVRITALADLRSSPGTRLNQNTLIYTWKLGDQILQKDSGIGRNQLNAVAPVRYRDAQVSVTVTDADSTLVAQSSTMISPIDPVIRIYRNDALMGPDFDHALSGTYTMLGEEEAFRGIAYYFGTQPSLAWSVGGQSASASNDVTVRTTGTGKGSANLSLNASNADTNQNVTGSVLVNFGAKKTNIFGF